MPAPFGIDVADNLKGPVKFGNLQLVAFAATFSSGVATLVAAQSVGGVTIAKTAAGRYAVSFPAGNFIIPLNMTLDLGASVPSAATVKAAWPRLMNAPAGTFEAQFFNTDDGGPEDPQDTMTFYCSFLVGAL